MKLQVIVIFLITATFAQKDTSIHLLKEISNQLSLTDVMNDYEEVCGYDKSVTIGGNMFSRATFKAADDWLNNSYQKIVKSIKDTVKLNALIKAQKSWLQYRNDNSYSKIATSGWGGSGRHMRAGGVSVFMTMERTKELRNNFARLFSSEIETDDLIGVWQNINSPKEIIKFEQVNDTLILRTNSRKIRCTLSNGKLKFHKEDIMWTKIISKSWDLFIDQVLYEGEWKITLNNRSDGGGFISSYVKVFSKN